MYGGAWWDWLTGKPTQTAQTAQAAQTATSWVPTTAALAQAAQAAQAEQAAQAAESEVIAMDAAREESDRLKTALAVPLRMDPLNLNRKRKKGKNGKRTIGLKL
jgi:hypothetical protein